MSVRTTIPAFVLNLAREHTRRDWFLRSAERVGLDIWTVSAGHGEWNLPP